MRTSDSFYKYGFDIIQTNNMYISYEPKSQVEAPGDITVTGTVIDSEGLAVPFAVVMIEGTAEGVVTDAEGNVYATVTIGNQVWMAENLSTSKFSNGDSIPMVYDNLPWQQATVIQSPAACFYNNDSINDTPMGKLYNWYAVIDSRNVCPSGWHIPSDAEWSQLIVHLDSLTIVGDDVESSLVGAQIKSTGLQFWLAPNTGAVNQSGFSALPGGKRPATGLYYPIFEYYSYYGYFWSSTSSQTPGLAYDRYLDYASTAILRTTSPKGEGKSVRCVKD
jgi:uncharacterized protein (TIGR02145 family)